MRVIKITLILWVIICIVTGCASDFRSLPHPEDTNPITLESVCEEIINTPEKEINLGKYAMLMTKAVCPSMFMEYELQKLDEMADGVRPRLKGITDPQERVDILNKYFFEELRFEGSGKPDDDPNYYLIHYATWRRRAHCVTVGIIYLCLAERLNLPIYGAVIPKHFFVRYDDGKTRINIDTTYKRGQNIPDEQYIKELYPLIKETDTEIWKRIHRNMTKKEALADYLMTIVIDKIQGASYANCEHALKYIDYTIKLSPDSYNIYELKANTLYVVAVKSRENDYTFNKIIMKESLDNFLIAYNLYPYDSGMIWMLIKEYYLLEDYENCLKKIDELFAKFPIDQIQTSTKMTIAELNSFKKDCEEKLLGKSNKSNYKSLSTPEIKIK